MSAPRRPQWAVFDLNGTLLDPASIADGLPGVAGAEDVGRAALADTIVAMLTLSRLDEWRPLPELLRGALARRLDLAGVPAGPDVLDAAMAAAGRMRPFPEAAAALELLAAAGVRCAVLTNSPTETAEKALAAGGLRDRFAHVVGSDGVCAFKPDPRVYEGGLRALGAKPHEAVMVASHWWDLLGARGAGMRVAWVGREERVLSPLLPDPDVAGPDLVAVAREVAEIAGQPAPRGAVRRSWEDDRALAPLIRQMLSAVTEAEVRAAESAADAWLASHPDDPRTATVRSAGESLWMIAESYRGADVIPFPGAWPPAEENPPG